jgi:hypothetical protein
MTSPTFGSAPKALKHFVVIRLGLGVYNEAWYDDRLALFEAITCASLRAQTESGTTVKITSSSKICSAIHSSTSSLLFSTMTMRGIAGL